MKRNRKAEAKKKERLLSRQDVETKRVAVLLTEMEAAAGQVLKERFGWDQAKIDQFLEVVRERFKAKSSGLDRAKGDRKLMLVSQLFGLIGVERLVFQFGFSAARADEWLKGLIERGKKNRER